MVACHAMRNAGRLLWRQPHLRTAYKATAFRRVSTQVPLTCEQYPDLQRGPYATLCSEDIAKFQSLLTPSRVVQDAHELSAHNQDWLNTCRGASQLLLRPKTTQEVSDILAYCHQRRLAVVPQSGNTSLVAGSTPVFDEIILSMSLMDQVINMDEVSGILVCQAGCVLEKLDNFLSERGFMMPLDLGAKGSCMIGGNIATNAGGLRLLRYGSLHGNILGLEVVLADGTIVDCLTSNRKDNTGYDVKHLFIGSEGTLGVITASSIITPYLPKSVNVAFFTCHSYKMVQEIFMRAKSMLGEVLSAFEMLDDGCIGLVETQLGLSCPITRGNFYVLVETSGSNPTHDEEKLMLFSEHLINQGFVSDGTVATDKQKMQHLWKMRESVAEAALRLGYNFKYDLSIPVPNLYDLVEIVREQLGPRLLCSIGYGHIGDGNLHLNVVTEQYDEDVHRQLEPFVFEWVRDCSGSVSAEHGIGFKKTKYLHYSKSNESIAIMRNLKRMFDPRGILSPYKVLSD